MNIVDIIVFFNRNYILILLISQLFIAHRLSAVKQADRVFVFDEGRIIEEGHHESLIRENGLYAKLYGKQGHSYRSTTD